MNYKKKIAIKQQVFISPPTPIKKKRSNYSKLDLPTPPLAISKNFFFQSSKSSFYINQIHEFLLSSFYKHFNATERITTYKHTEF